ncbi:hypothetical protein FA13DRAFT_1110081 [Coprinellus micaceus]|uniref:Uncharacterized protein n=1 Tax=Coprinellus micaceus TaxID=71717 RepID=A0A4Y7SW12_COPMI|nr:hypothetical protein FA13DRAFT_1110081 [Coprinellus micaceus]
MVCLLSKTSWRLVTRWRFLVRHLFRMHNICYMCPVSSSFSHMLHPHAHPSISCSFPPLINTYLILILTTSATETSLHMFANVAAVDNLSLELVSTVQKVRDSIKKDEAGLNQRDG